MSINSFFKNYSQPIIWKNIETNSYTLTIPSDWEESQDGFKGVLKRESWSIYDPDPFDASVLCDSSYHTATLEIYKKDSSDNYLMSDGSTGYVLTKEEAKDYLITIGSRADNPTQILIEHELENGADLIVAEGRFGSAPCISSQYFGIIVDGKNAIIIELRMDEERYDIVYQLYESITPLLK